MFLRLIVAICLACFSSVIAARDLDMVKMMLRTRDMEPKIYLPESMFLGQKTRVMVDAPGAKSVALLFSFQQGDVAISSVIERTHLDIKPSGGIDGKTLRLGEDFVLLAKEENLNNQATFRPSFELNIPEQAELTSSKLRVEAIVNYQLAPDEILSKRAIIFGSNANYNPRNEVAILARPKDQANLANFARSMMPGMMGSMQAPQN